VQAGKGYISLDDRLNPINAELLGDSVHVLLYNRSKSLFSSPINMIGTSGRRAANYGGIKSKRGLDKSL
jgi:hypothetical protein